MNRNDLSDLLNRLTGNLQLTTEQNDKELVELRAELVRVLASQSTVQDVPLFFQVERTDGLEDNLSDDGTRRDPFEGIIDDELAKEQESGKAEFRVFRRSAPIRSPRIPGSIPHWGRNAELVKTRGPFLDASGLQFWFDIYKVTRVVRVFFSNHSAPALLLPLTMAGRLSGRAPSYSVGQGSIWIRADLFVMGAPPDSYVGLKVQDGRITFSQSITIVDDQVSLPVGASMELSLELDPVTDTSTYDGASGVDVRKATVDLPSSCAFSIDATSVDIQEIDNGAWRIYNDARRFAYRQGSASYSPLLNDILIDFETSRDRFGVDEGAVGSEVVTLAGQAPVLQAAWSHPLTIIDNPAAFVPDAAGTGAWALSIGPGMGANWLGLERGPVALNESWMVLQPGQFEWISLEAGNIYARQSYELWPNEAGTFHATARLQYDEQFAFRYLNVSTGSEVLITVCDSDIQTDRPVRVNGRPFEVKGKDTLLLLYDVQEQRRILLFDPNILQDNLEQTANPQNPFESHAVALNNVLLTTSQVMAFLLTGTLATESSIESGNLHFLHALFRWLPTLPDPYAANLDFLFRQQERGSIRQTNFRLPIAFLLATVTWPPEPAEQEAGATARVDYQFFPYLQQQRTFTGIEATGTITSQNVGEETVASSSVGTSLARATTAASGADIASRAELTAVARASTVDDVYIPGTYEGPWNELVRQFGFDLFALLDVSTNADLMGVMYSPMNERYILEITHVPINDDIPSVPIQIDGLDLKASGKYVKAFTVPLVSWEPVLNTSDISEKTVDPPPGSPQNPRQLLFPNDGGPTRIFNNSAKTVTLAPVPLSNFIIEEFQGDEEPLTFSIFTLPYGMQAVALFEKTNPFAGNQPPSDIDFNRPEFDEEVKGGIQFKAVSAYNPEQGNKTFRGNTVQLTNLISSKPNPTSILGESVTEIFNREFSTVPKGPLINRGVPVERIDMSGYGSSMFSNWLNDKAKFAQTSQAKFDIFTGRTAHEIIQVRSILYPWGVGVVRTIVLYRPASGFVYRVDSGWRADSDGLFDFNVTMRDTPANQNNLVGSFFSDVSDPFNVDIDGVPTPFVSLTPYEIHPGIIKGVYNVKNIQETTDIEAYTRAGSYSNIGLDQNGSLETGTFFPDIKLVPVWFTADIDMDFVEQGTVKGRVPSKKMLGFIQIAPEGIPIPASDFVNLLEQYPAIGGDIDCLVNIGDSGQKMRLKRVEMDPSLSAGNTPIFVGTPKGNPVLPADGSWALVQHNEGTGEITPVADTNGLPLIRRGALVFDAETSIGTVPIPSPNLRIANARELIKAIDTQSINFGFLQNTGTQKVLFRRPNFNLGIQNLLSQAPDYADAYHLLNSKGIFPNLSDISESLDLAAQNVEVAIIEKGYQLVDSVGDALTAPFEHVIQGNRWYWVGSENGDEPVKIYIEYSLQETEGALNAGGLNFELDSLAEKWTSDLNATTLNIDLADISPLFLIKGNFESKNGLVPGINAPTLEFGPTLKPIADVLQVLAEISKFPNLDYAALLEKGLEIAMSNTPEVWEYKFSAKKEIPVLRFPPPALDGPTSPLRIEASLAVGCYFNESLSLTTDIDQLIPSAGAFVEFYGQLSVMCVSIAAATVYAIGQTRVKIYADLEEGPGLSMEYGFGVELAVGLPVIGTVALTYMVGIAMELNSKELQVDAFLLFKGRAELIGGLVTVTIMIEARGSVNRQLGSGRTDMIAQVTFGLEISIFLVINLSFEESWEERRQIA